MVGIWGTLRQAGLQKKKDKRNRKLVVSSPIEASKGIYTLGWDRGGKEPYTLGEKGADAPLKTPGTLTVRGIVPF